MVWHSIHTRSGIPISTRRALRSHYEEPKAQCRTLVTKLKSNPGFLDRYQTLPENKQRAFQGAPWQEGPRIRPTSFFQRDLKGHKNRNTSTLPCAQPGPSGTVPRSQHTLVKELHGHAVQLLLCLAPQLHQGEEAQQQRQVPRGCKEQRAAQGA